LIELIALKALISGVRECSSWKDLYALLERSFFKVKKVMKNHIQVEKVSILRHRLKSSTCGSDKVLNPTSFYLAIR